MENTPKISIIANFYNSERFIPKLIKSILAQTYHNWELICVNDCSQMNDLDVIQSYAKVDSRIIVVDNKKNLGIAKAKFEGIKHAKGEYLMFIDGDDWLEPESLQKCIEPAEKYGIDMVLMGTQRVLYRYFTLYKKKNPLNNTNKIISKPEVFDNYFINFFGVNLFPASFWGKLIRRSVIEKANPQPAPQNYCEDLWFNIQIWPMINSIYMLDYIGYNWRYGGLTCGKIKPTEKNVIKLLSYILEFFQMRMEILNKYEYLNAKRFLTIELVNYIIGCISSIANDENISPQIYNIITEYINVFSENERFVSDCVGEKYDAFRVKDVRRIYLYCLKVHKKNKVRNMIKRFILFS